MHINSIFRGYMLCEWYIFSKFLVLQILNLMKIHNAYHSHLYFT